MHIAGVAFVGFFTCPDSEKADTLAQIKERYEAMSGAVVVVDPNGKAKVCAYETAQV